MDGDFAGVAISSKATDITFDGHATGIDILGAAVHGYAYDTIRQDETVSINARSHPGGSRLPGSVPVDYSVIAKAVPMSIAWSRVCPAPGRASASRGDFVHARIR